MSIKEAAAQMVEQKEIRRKSITGIVNRRDDDEKSRQRRAETGAETD